MSTKVEEIVEKIETALKNPVDIIDQFTKICNDIVLLYLQNNKILFVK
jgi:hypothetical protein